MAACKECGTALPRGAKNCPECGTAVPPRATKAPAKPAAKAAAKPAAKVAKPAAKPAAKAAAGPAAKRPAKAAAVTPEPPVEAGSGETAVEAPTPRRRAALASDGSAARRRALQGTLPPPVESGPPPAPPAPSEAPTAWSGTEALGAADERDPRDPVVPPPPGPFGSAGTEGRPHLAQRVLRGDWRASVLAAAPAIAATLVLAALAAVAVLTATRPGSEGGELVVEGTGAGRWLSYVCVTVGLAFGSPVTMSMSDGGEGSFFFPDEASIGFAPLTVTFLALAVLWLGARRVTRRGPVDDWAPDAVRTAGVFALGVALLSLFGRWTVKDGGGSDSGFGFGGGGERVTTTFSVWPPKVFFWAFLAAFAVLALAYLLPYWPRRWAAWGAAVRGALVGVGFGVGVSFVVALVLAYVNADRVDASASDVTRAMPAFLAYVPNLGTAAYGVASGGGLGLGYAERAGVTLWSSWLPGWYLLLFVVPVLAVGVGALYVVRRSGLPPAEAARACARMALPAGLAWGLLAVAGSVYSGVMLGGGRTGPRLWDALLVGLWFGVFGWLFGRLLARRARV